MDIIQREREGIGMGKGEEESKRDRNRRIWRRGTIGCTEPSRLRLFKSLNKG